MYKIFAFLFCFLFFAESSIPLKPDIRVYQEIVFSINLPDWAISCDEIPVYSNSFDEPIYYLDQGKKVRIRYGSKNNNYANIGIGEWVKTTDLCEVE